MGGKTKTEQTNKPVYSKEIGAAANNLTSVYNQNKGAIQGYADQIGGLTGGLIERYQQGDPAVNAARDYVTSTLSATPGENPYLDDMIARTGRNVATQTNGFLGSRGLAGGSVAAGMLADRLSGNELNLRYNDYNNMLGRQERAAGMAPGVVAGDLMTLAPAMSTAQFGAMLPMQAANQYAAGTGGLLGQYQNVRGTQQQNPGLMDFAGLGLQAASLFSDARLKTDVTQVGMTDGGLPVFTYRYGGEGPFHMGVMAQDVAQAQPDALGEERDGFMTVDYGKVA